ncbi:flagellar biosynthetic protein FliO [Arthrobacter sp. NPDC057259]|uniref:flagellar biosynthetic protein FliO n=1 Tax=Arthrobacter sp. NPDC057259 TaxID=3346073 RepID=UPI00362A6BAF
MDSLILGLRVVVALGAVLGLIWVLQRRLGKGPGRRRADATLSVVSRQSVGQRASVVVVDAGGQRFLLGVTDHAVNVLHTGEIPEEPVEATDAEPRRGAAGAFAQILAATGANGATGPAAVPAVTVPAAPGATDAAAATVAADAPVPGVPAAELPLSRRSSMHRDGHPRTAAGRPTPGTTHPPLHGSILSGSTWKQAAAALRSGRRN